MLKIAYYDRTSVSICVGLLFSKLLLIYVKNKYIIYFKILKNMRNCLYSN